MMFQYDDFCIGTDGNLYTLHGSEWIERIAENYICSEFVGLFDANGVPIYEYDILSHGKGEKGVVEYHANATTFGLMDRSGPIPRLTFIPFGGMTVNVIGNIFENADLVEIYMNPHPELY